MIPFIFVGVVCFLCGWMLSDAPGSNADFLAQIHDHKPPQPPRPNWQMATELVPHLVDDMDDAGEQGAEEKSVILNPNGDPNKVAILFGINRCDPRVYQGDSLPLKGCVNDMRNLRQLLTVNGYGRIYFFSDKTATISNFLKTWGEVAAKAKAGDTIFLAMSRHGMSLGANVLDVQGDIETKAKNPDGEVYEGDQAAVMHDGLIVDDCFFRLFKLLPEGVNLTYWNDSCHSATQYRVSVSPLAPEKYQKARAVSSEYVPAKDRILDLKQLDRLIPKTDGPLKCSLLSLAGCQDHEYSADAYIGTTYQGAFTAYMIKALKTSPTLPASETVSKAKSYLKMYQYDQNPQLNIEGPDQERAKKPIL